jgi:transcriptional regulator with XRE-family HTH domain
LVSTPRNNFGRRLREHRERHEITLDAIAAVTKINRSVLAGLERGDVSSWPNGIFRRAFVREYAAAVGLSPEAVVAEFVQLFPDSGATMDTVTPAAPPTSLRLILAVDPRELVTASLVRALAALGEAGLIAAAALAISRTTATSFWLLCGGIALAYYTLATSFLGRSPASWYLDGGHHALWHRPPLQSPAVSDARDLLYLVKRGEEPRREPEPIVSAESAPSPTLRAASR